MDIIIQMENGDVIIIKVIILVLVDETIRS